MERIESPTRASVQHHVVRLFEPLVRIPACQSPSAIADGGQVYPLSYGRMVGLTGLEPVTSSM